MSFHHTKSVHAQIHGAREALGAWSEAYDEYRRLSEKLAVITINESQFTAFLDRVIPVPAGEGAARTNALNKRQQITNNYRHDHRQTESNYNKTMLALFHSVTQMADHYMTRRRTPERRFMQSITGSGNKLKQTAWGIALEAIDAQA